MSNLMKISDAASYAIHTMIRVTQAQNNTLSVNQIAKELEISENHLAKVCQRLVKAGFLHSQRGPNGGISLAKDPSSISLLKIYEAIEGPLSLSGCLLKKKACNSNTCKLGNLVKNINELAYNFLISTKLSDIALEK